MFWCQKSVGAFTYCNVLSNHFPVMFLYIWDIEMEVHVSITLMPFHYFASFHILNTFIQNVKSSRGRYIFLIIFPLHPWHLLIPSLYYYHLGDISSGGCWPHRGELSKGTSESSWDKITLASYCLPQPIVNISIDFAPSFIWFLFTLK